MLKDGKMPEQKEKATQEREKFLATLMPAQRERMRRLMQLQWARDK